MANNRLTRVYPTQMLTGDLEYFHLTTPFSIVPTADRESEDSSVVREFFVQARVWERIIEVIRTRANVVIIGVLDASGFSFAVEHGGAIDVDQMQQLIRDIGEVDFSSDGTTTVDLSTVELVQRDFRLDLA